jgi:NAD+ kinase
MKTKRNIKSVGFVLSRKLQGKDIPLLRELESYLKSQGVTVYPASSPLKYEKSQLLFVFGGDGTLLEAARHVGTRAVPLVGIKKGTLGFLMELPEQEALAAAKHILAGQYTFDVRQRLCVIVKEGRKAVRSFLALNDAVIQNYHSARVLKMTVQLNNHVFSNLVADGLIVATPTGSTGYSLSAGGPVIFPSNSVMVMTPICPHALNHRPTVLSDKEHILISVDEGVPLLTIDGQVNVRIKKNQSVEIKRSDFPVYLVKTKEISYFFVLQQKFQFLK